MNVETKAKLGRKPLPKGEQKTLVGVYIENYKIKTLGGKVNTRTIILEDVDARYRRLKK